MKKFYWISYQYFETVSNGSQEMRFSETVVDKHPFELITEMCSNGNIKNLINYREITEEEYNIAKQEYKKRFRIKQQYYFRDGGR